MLETLLPEARAHYRRNFALGVANGAIFALAEALQDPTLVLSVFIHRLTGSSLLVGLLMPLSVGGWYLPQLLLSGRVQASPRKMPYYRSSGVGRIVANVGLALSALLVRDPRLLVLLLFLMVATNTLSGGMSGLAFTSIVGKVIPSRRRGRFFALRLFIGGALVFAGSLLARRLLAEPPGFAFPINYAVLFGISAAAVIVSFFCLSAVREPADLSVRPRVGVLAQLRRAADLPKRNRSYRGFLIARSCLMLAEVAAPFYIIYAGERFGVPESLAGTYLLVAALANMASTYLWARVSDNVGNRDVLRLAAAGGALAPVLALAAAPLLAGLSGGAAIVVFGALFALLGVCRTGTFIGGTNYLLDVCPTDDRTIYIGLTNTLVGLASLATAVGGVVIELAGFSPLFALALALYLTAAIAITLAGEPRTAPEPA